MKSKRAILVEPKRFDFEIVEVVPRPNEVLIKVAACGLCNWELNHWKGIIGPFPQRLGHEWTGVVVEVGKEVNKFKPGDKVTVLSGKGFSEYAVAAEDLTFRLSENIEPKYALGEPLKCVITVVRAAAPEAGDFGVIMGCGPMGLCCIQAMRGRLLAALIAIDIDDEKLAIARKFGATHTINPRYDNVEKRVKEITKGHMADFVIEGTGNPMVLNTASQLVRMTQGRIILMSSHEKEAERYDFRHIIEKGAKILAPHPPYSLNQVDDMRRAIELINNGTFDFTEMITHEFKLDDIQKAFETLEKKPANFIKGIVVP